MSPTFIKYWKAGWRFYFAFVLALDLREGRFLLSAISLLCWLLTEWIWWRMRERERLRPPSR